MSTESAYHASHADYRLMALEMANDDAMYWRAEAMAMRIVAVEAIHRLHELEALPEANRRLNEMYRRLCERTMRADGAEARDQFDPLPARPMRGQAPRRRQFTSRRTAPVRRPS